MAGTRRWLLVCVVLLAVVACSKPSGDAYIGTWKLARGCTGEKCETPPKPKNAMEDAASTTEITRNGEVFVVKLSSFVTQSGVERAPAKAATRKNDGSLYVELKEFSPVAFSIIHNEKTDNLEIRFANAPKGTEAESLVFYFVRS